MLPKYVSKISLVYIENFICVVVQQQLLILMLLIFLNITIGKVNCRSGKGHEDAGQVATASEEITFGTGRF